MAGTRYLDETMREQSKKLTMCLIMIALIVGQQLYAAAQAKVHRAELIREIGEVKALVWLAAERSGNQ